MLSFIYHLKGCSNGPLGKCEFKYYDISFLLENSSRTQSVQRKSLLKVTPNEGINGFQFKSNFLFMKKPYSTWVKWWAQTVFAVWKLDELRFGSAIASSLHFENHRVGREHNLLRSLPKQSWGTIWFRWILVFLLRRRRLMC